MALLSGFCLLLLLQIAGEVTTRYFELAVPGPVIGLGYLLLAQMLSKKAEETVREASSALLAHLSLLFIPAGVGVVAHLARLGDAALPIVAIIALSTVAGLIVTALTMQWFVDRESDR